LRRWILLVSFLLASCGLSVATAQAATFYIAADGSDSYNGASQTTPWQHLPGMPSCTGTCASYTPQPGDQFIFRGGDTWGASDLGVSWQWSGTSAKPIYIGVDQTWYSSGVCGASWCRPIWSCGGQACSGTGLAANFWNTGNSYVTLDNIEMTGLLASATNSPSYILSWGAYQIYDHLYIHGWSHSGATSDDSAAFGGNGGYNITGTTIRNSVIDGSDTTQDMLACFFATIPNAYNNVCRYATNGFEGSGDNWHDNLVEYIVPCFTGNCHQNAMFHFGPAYASSIFMYNNVIRHTTWSGGVPKMWLSGNNANTATGYAFNNVIFDNAVGNLLNLGGHNAVNYGTWYYFNNTVGCGTDSAQGICTGDDPAAGETFTVHFINNHWLTSTPAIDCTSASCPETTDRTQTVSAANGQGYNSSQTYAFSPASGSGSTVGTGTNEQSLCATINALNATAGAACKNDTGYACTYNTNNHRVSCPARPPVARPSSGAWDVGAYQFTAGSGGGTPPAAPQGLRVR
jgi:hypothetical protein